MVWAAIFALVMLPRDDLSAQFVHIAREARGRVGAALGLVDAGARGDIALNGDERFPMQSVYKVPIAMAVLRLADLGRIKLDQPVHITRSDLVPTPLHSPIRDRHPNGGIDLSVRELIRLAIVESDGTASDVLLRLGGGPREVTGYLRRIGVRDVIVATTEKEMASGARVQYRNWATPCGALGLLRGLDHGSGLKAQSRALLLRFMTETGTGPKRIKGLLPAGTVVAHKTGTSGTAGGLTRATNDIGIVTLPDGRRLAVAVFVSDSRANEVERERVIARIARAAWDHWTRKGVGRLSVNRTGRG